MAENKKLTDSEIVKALEEQLNLMGYVTNGCYLDTAQSFQMYETLRVSLDLINRLQAENKDLFYKLEGVMHSVDKWLDGDELKQDEVNRAITMREKTLKIVENLQAENDRKDKNYIDLLKTSSARVDIINELRAENERLKEILNTDFIIPLESDDTSSLVIVKIDSIKAEAYKECIEKVDKELSLIRRKCKNNLDDEGVFAIDRARKKVDNLLKEMVGDTDV